MVWSDLSSLPLHDYALARWLLFDLGVEFISMGEGGLGLNVHGVVLQALNRLDLRSHTIGQVHSFILLRSHQRDVSRIVLKTIIYLVKVWVNHRADWP